MILFMYTCNTLIAWLLIKLETSNHCVKALNNYLTYKHTNSIYARQPLHHSPIIYQPVTWTPILYIQLQEKIF